MWKSVPGDVTWHTNLLSAPMITYYCAFSGNNSSLLFLFKGGHTTCFTSSKLFHIFKQQKTFFYTLFKADKRSLSFQSFFQHFHNFTWTLWNAVQHHVHILRYTKSPDKTGSNWSLKSKQGYYSRSSTQQRYFHTQKKKSLQDSWHTRMVKRPWAQSVTKTGYLNLREIILHIKFAALLIVGTDDGFVSVSILQTAFLQLMTVLGLITDTEVGSDALIPKLLGHLHHSARGNVL